MKAIWINNVNPKLAVDTGKQTRTTTREWIFREDTSRSIYSKGRLQCKK